MKRAHTAAYLLKPVGWDRIKKKTGLPTGTSDELLTAWQTEIKPTQPWKNSAIFSWLAYWE